MKTYFRSLLRIGKASTRSAKHAAARAIPAPGEQNTSMPGSVIKRRVLRALRWQGLVLGLVTACILLIVFFPAHQFASAKTIRVAQPQHSVHIIIPAHSLSETHHAHSKDPAIECNPTESLADQSNFCSFSGSTANGPFSCTTSPESGGDPTLQLYSCAITVTSTGQQFTYQCEVPKSDPLDSVSFTCSYNRTQLKCSFNFASVATCPQNSCDPLPAVQSPDPLTGLPQQTPLPATTATATATSTAVSCPIPVPDCPAPTGDKPDASDWLFGSTNGLLVSTTDAETYALASNIVNTLWKVVAGLALALLAIPFLLAGYQLMLGVSSKNHADAVEALSRVFLVAGAVVLSYYAVSMLIDLESGFAQYLFKALPVSVYDAMPSANWQNCAHQFFGNIFNLSMYSTLQASQQISTQEYAQSSASTTLLIVENLPHYILTLLSIILTIQLVIRLALLNFHIILSPLTILCGALPGQIGPNAAKHWVQSFLALLFVQLMQLLVLLLGSTLIAVPTALSGTDWAGTLFSEVLKVAMLLIALNMPRLFNISATTLLASVSSSMGGAMSGITMIIRGL